MATARDHLDRYNAAAIALGRQPLKSWKGSTTAIQVKANQLEAELAAQKPQRDADEATVKVKKSRAAKRSPDSVAQYYAAHSINPKVARAKMRAAGYSAPYTLEQVKKVLGK